MLWPKASSSQGNAISPHTHSHHHHNHDTHSHDHSHLLSPQSTKSHSKLSKKTTFISARKSPTKKCKGDHKVVNIGRRKMTVVAAIGDLKNNIGTANFADAARKIRQAEIEREEMAILR